MIAGYGIASERVLVPLVGAALLGGVYAIAYVCAPSSLGAGDVKLALGVGAVTAFGGGGTWVLAAAAAPVATALVGVSLRWRDGGVSVATLALPHGASMCGASAFALTVALV